MNSAAPVRLAFAGAGNVLGAYLAVLERLEAQGLARLAAVCAPERHRQRLVGELRLPDFTTDYDAVLARADIDAVVILTPMPQHAPMAKAALRAGKHVVLEKPLATNLDDARGLLQEAARSGKHLVCAPFTTLSPTFQAIARRLREGDIGAVVSARGRYGWAGPDWSAWFYRPGGGALFDLAVYNLTTLTGWLGPVQRVTAMMGVAIPERIVRGETIKVEAEDNVQLLLDFGRCCFAAVTAGFTLQQYQGSGLELYGTEGTIQLRGDDWDPDGYDWWQNTAGCWRYFKETHPEWPWCDGLRHLVECLRHGSPPVVTPKHAFHVLEVMLRAQESARSGQALEIHSRFTPPALLEAEGAGVAAYRVHDRTRGGRE